MRFSRSMVFGILLAVAIVQPAPVCADAPRRVEFREAEFAPFQGKGTGAVAGQLVATSADGETHIGNDEHITLLPVTPYTQEMVDREIGNGESLAPSDTRLRPYVRLMKTDDHGNFRFDHLPPGDYFVSGLVQWYFGDDAIYQWACERITVHEGKVTQVRVSKNLQRPGKPTLVIWALQ